MILNDTQAAIRDTVRDFVQERLRPHSAAFEAAGGFPPALFEEMAGLGLMGMTAPEAVGGAGADTVSYALALMEIAAGEGALSTIVSIQNSLLVGGLLKPGTPAQQARFLPDLIAGRTIGAFALTETDAGSDASAIRTRAWRAARRRQAVHHLRQDRRAGHRLRGHRSGGGQARDLRLPGAHRSRRLFGRRGRAQNGPGRVGHRRSASTICSSRTG